MYINSPNESVGTAIPTHRKDSYLVQLCFTALLTYCQVLLKLHINIIFSENKIIPH